MDTRNPSAPPCAESRNAGKSHPRTGGLTHDNTRHTTRFTVIGNHLAQHPELSGLAIGLAVYIQSLPTGARADIKTLAARFPEGATRIAAALRELEAHGYLRRTRERVPGGRIVTRTVSCNQPGGRPHHEDEPDRQASTPPPARRRPRSAHHVSPSPPYRAPRTPPPPSSRRQPTSSPTSAATTPDSSSPPATPPTSLPASPPGWSETSAPPSYGRS